MVQSSDGEADVARIGQARVLVLLCTYQEAENLPLVFDLIEQISPALDLLVVDDNSPDGSSQVVSQRAASNRRIHLLKRSGKLGLGSALREGIQWCLQRDYDYVVNLDADLSHDPRAIPDFIGACAQGGFDVAVGSRYIPGGGFAGLAWHRRWISRCLNGYATRILRLPIHDCSGSYRCYRVTCLKNIDLGQLTCNGYGFLEEILVALHRHGATLIEVPIQFDLRQSGKSKLGFRDILGAFRVIHRLAIKK